MSEAIMVEPLVGLPEGLSRGQVGAKLELSGLQQQLLAQFEGGIPLRVLTNLAGRSSKSKFRSQVLKPLIDTGYMALTISDKPTSSNQKYRLTAFYRNEGAQL